MSRPPEPPTVEHCRNLLQGTGYGVFREPPRRWTQRFNGHPLEAQAYFLTGYLAKASPYVRQDLRDLVIAVGIPMPPIVDEGAVTAAAFHKSPLRTLRHWWRTGHWPRWYEWPGPGTGDYTCERCGGHSW